MQITIIVPDKTVYCDGLAIEMPDLDWSTFDGDPATPWDDIHAVQFNATAGQGHVEYKEILTHQAARPNIKPPSWGISMLDFEANFAWVLPAFAARKAQIEAENAAREAAERAAAEAQAAAPAFSAEPGEWSAPSASSEDLEALKAEIAALKESAARNTSSLQNLKTVMEGGGV